MEDVTCAERRYGEVEMRGRRCDDICMWLVASIS